MNLKYIKILVLLILGMNSVAWAQDENKGVVIDKIVAKVDDYIVLKSDLENAYNQFMSRGQMVPGDVRCQILENLVINKLMVAKAEIDSVEVMDIQVEQNLDQRLSYFVQQFGSEERLEEYYDKTIEEFREELFDQIKEQMIVQKMQGVISNEVTITPAEVKKFFEKVPTDSLPYFSKEVMIGHIVKIPEANDKVKDNVRLQLVDLKDQIEGGMDFGVLAQKYSMDPGSARQGGELGFFNRGELAPEFEATALGLKPGQISDPVETQFGYHIIQLIEKRGNRFNTRHILIIPQPTLGDIEETKDFLDSLRTTIIEDSMRFDILAKEHSDDKETSGNGGFFSDQSGAMRVSVEELDPTMFFTIDTMKVGEISKPFEYKMRDGKDAVRIVYYKSSVAPHQANLKQDYQKIRMSALTNKQNGILSDWFDEARGEVYINIEPEYDYCRILSD